MTHYDFFADIHADLDRLLTSLDSAGYVRGPDDLWFAPKGRKAIFLSDLIDNGTQNAAVLKVVRKMVEFGQAECILGNHELNAILFHSEGPRGGPLRERNDKNRAQHETFISEFGEGTPQALHWVRWFMTLPLIIEKPDFRAVHAYWSKDHADTILERRPDARLRTADLQEIADEEGSFANAVLDVVKGPDAPLPAGSGFVDRYGHYREKGRIRWWDPAPKTWEDRFVSLGNGCVMPDGPPVMEGPPAYPESEKMVVFGHYKLEGEFAPAAANAVCLDYPEAAVVLRTGAEDAVIRVRPQELSPAV